jgi:hypothetical protein
VKRGTPREGRDSLGRFKGQHEAIIDRETWDAVQAQLKSNGHERQLRSRAQDPNLLSGLLVDEQGMKLTSTHAVKDGKRYRYYVSPPRDAGAGSGWRLPAHDIETLVTTELVAFLSRQQRRCDALQPWTPSPDQLEGAFHAAEVFAQQLAAAMPARRAADADRETSPRARSGAHHRAATRRTPR